MQLESVMSGSFSEKKDMGSARGFNCSSLTDLVNCNLDPVKVKLQPRAAREGGR